MRRSVPAASLAALLAAACGGDPARAAWSRGEAVAQLVAEQVRAVPPGSAVSLENLAPFRWERLFVLDPGGPSPTVRDSLGPFWSALAATAPDDRPGAHLLVFLAGGEIVAAAALAADAATLAPELTGRGYTPAEAVFRVERDTGRAVPPRLTR